MPYTPRLFILFVLMHWVLTPSYAVEAITVGTVTLAIGRTQATNQQGVARVLARSDAIFVGDVIETNQSAHLHIKFIDDGRISIRPESRLHIEAYQYDRHTPANSAIRFFLEQGVLRSISGKATEAAHDRYRMNTPVAALGVLGTDYVVKTSEQQTLAAVYSGGIALSPINQGCSNAGFGSCSSATVLTAEMGHVYLEVNRGEAQSQLKNQDGLIYKSLHKGDIATHNRSSTAGSNSASADTSKNSPATTDTRAPKQDSQHNESRQDLHANELSPSVIDADLASNAKLGTSPSPKPAPVEPEPIKPAPVKPEPIKPIPTEPSVFSWVRWPWQSAHPEDRLSQDEANKDKQTITIGNGYAGLFRNTDTGTLQRPDTGVYNFTLHNSHAVFIPSGKNWQTATPAKIDNAQLQIDFGHQQFNTQMDLSAANQASAQLNVQGSIDSEGLFRGQNATDRAVGALSESGNQAGMSFDKSTDNGHYTGITEWRK